ncbi:MAG: adenylate/guanylate cyclase domain-containing protein, partial [Thermodesulfobacteriota bacterium]|nr:adenylate/guanylate cyclase domain-containing protein [Thermodesulfobacteriota bacterium]
MAKKTVFVRTLFKNACTEEFDTKAMSLSGFRISLLITILVILIYLMGFSFLDLMELKALDLRFASRGQIESGDEVVIATIDEKSLDTLGRWPWPRKQIARLIDILTDYDVKAIGFDIVFAEPDENFIGDRLVLLKQKIAELGLSNQELSRYISMAEKETDHDKIFAESIKRSDRVILGYFLHTTEMGLEHLDRQQIDIGFESISSSKYPSVRYQSQKAKSVSLKEVYAVEGNIDRIGQVARASGFFNIFPDRDGTIRWSQMVVQYKGMYFPSLPLRILHLYLGSPILALWVADYGIEGVQLGNLLIPTDEAGRMLINYNGPPKTFPHYSIADILDGHISKDMLKDKIVLVGATAKGIHDMRVTPFNIVHPGVEIHANVIDNILHQRFLIRPEWTNVIDIGIILGFGLLLGFTLPQLKAFTGAMATAFFFFAFFMLNRYLFIDQGIWINIVYPFLVLLAVYIGVTVLRYVTEEREKKRIKGAFNYYVTASVVNEMLRNPQKLKLGGEKKELTVLFSDIRGFTRISERLSPEALVKLLNEYLTAMTDIVFKYDGLLDKYMGDAIMAVYGAPLDQEDNALRACSTALDMVDELKTLQDKWEADGTPRLSIGIGISTGPMVVGNMGSQKRFDYTVMGDSVNLGSRLEGANKQYDTNILLSEFTYEKIKGKFICRELDSVRVKGKDLPVKIYELIGRESIPEEMKKILDLFHHGLEEYKNRKWKEAIGTFNEV